jgi:hypothetical protein
MSLDVPTSPPLYGPVAVLLCCTGLDLFLPRAAHPWSATLRPASGEGRSTPQASQ